MTIEPFETVRWKVGIDAEGHEANWKDNMGDWGLVEVSCDDFLGVDGPTLYVYIGKGWEEFRYCPSCGKEIGLESEKVSN